MKKRKIWLVGVSGLAVIAPIATVISCGGGGDTSKDEPGKGDTSGSVPKKDVFATYSDKAVSLNSLIGLAYQIDNSITPGTADKYDVKDTKHSDNLLIKQIDSLHKHVDQQHGQNATDLVATFGQTNLDAIYKVVEGIFGSTTTPVFTANIAEVGKAVEEFNIANFTLPTVEQLKTLGTTFTNIRNYAAKFENWTNRQVKLEIVARNGEEYKVVKTEAEAKTLAQTLKLATWPTHKDNSVAIYDGEFIVRVVG